MKRITSYLAAMFMVGELLLIMVSWLLSATTAGNVRSLLSGEGIRWLLGSFVDTLQTPLLVWLLLLAMAFGCLQACGCMRTHRGGNGRRRHRVLTPLRGALLLTLLFVAVVVVMVAVPRAVLLSATGSLWPSPFSQALVPLLALGTIVFAIAYGIMARTFTSFTAVVQALAQGVAEAAPLFVLYVLAAQFVASLAFVAL